MKIGEVFFVVSLPEDFSEVSPWEFLYYKSSVRSLFLEILKDYWEFPI